MGAKQSRRDFMKALERGEVGRPGGTPMATHKLQAMVNSRHFRTLAEAGRGTSAFIEHARNALANAPNRTARRVHPIAGPLLDLTKRTPIPGAGGLEGRKKRK